MWGVGRDEAIARAVGVRWRKLERVVESHSLFDTRHLAIGRRCLAMGYRITKYQATPNPNALKCFLSSPISDRPRSFRAASEVGEDALAASLFAVPGVAGLLLSGDWMTVNKAPDADWPAVKKGVERALAEITG